MANQVTLNLPLLGNIIIKIKDDNLYHFFKRQFKNYIVNVVKVDSPNFINISLELENLSIENCQFSRDIKFKDNNFDFVKTSKTQIIGFKYNMNNTIMATIDFEKKLLYYLKKMIKTKYSINHILFYQTILYPIFS